MQFTYKKETNTYSFVAVTSDLKEVNQFVSETKTFFDAIDERFTDPGIQFYVPCFAIDEITHDLMRWDAEAQSVVSLRGPAYAYREYKLRFNLPEEDAIKFKLMYDCVKEEDKQ